MQAVEVGAARNAFDLQLEELGPYRVAFTRSGRHMLLAGRKGHLALMDWRRAHVVAELQVTACPFDVILCLPSTLPCAAYVQVYESA